MIEKRIKNLICLTLAISFVLTMGISQVIAVDLHEEARQKFYKIEELVKLVEKVKEAGFSDEVINQLNLRDLDQSINVMDYINRAKLEEKLAKDRLLAFQKKKFLTIKDTFNELVLMEPEALFELRKDLISE